MNILITNIIRQLREVQSGKIWIGTNFDKKLQSISEEEAFRRPVPGLHSVAEIISHLTTWRKETILKIRTGKGSISDSDESNWLSNEKLREKGWKKIHIEYQNSLDEITELLESKEDDFLQYEYYDTDFKGNYPYLFVIEGMLHHDIYHLGQLGIIIRFLDKK